MNLTGTSDVIRFRLSSAHTTTAPDYYSASKILTVATGALGGLVRKQGVANGTTNVTCVDSPSGTEAVQVNQLTFNNVDTVDHTLIVEFYNGTTATKVRSAIDLPVGYTVEYTATSGRWITYNADGREVGSAGIAGSNGTDGADGALTVTEVEIDFGSVPVREKHFTITDAGVSATSKIIAVQSGKAATGRDADENEMDALVFNCKPETGQFVLNAFAIPGPVTGKYKVNYQFS